MAFCVRQRTKEGDPLGSRGRVVRPPCRSTGQAPRAAARAAGAFGVVAGCREPGPGVELVHERRAGRRDRDLDPSEAARSHPASSSCTSAQAAGCDICQVS